LLLNGTLQNGVVHPWSIESEIDKHARDGDFGYVIVGNELMLAYIQGCDNYNY
jgi:hypothetical protein